MGMIERNLSIEIDNTIEVMKGFMEAAMNRKHVTDQVGLYDSSIYNSPLKKLGKVKR
jgi:hypothetical protein